MINVSETAAVKINELLSEENKAGSALRVFVQGGGCSGFQYGLMIEENGQGTGDEVYESNGVKLLIDPISVRYLGGAEVDFVDTVTGGGLHDQEPERQVDLRLRPVVLGRLEIPLDLSGLRPAGGKRSSKRDRIVDDLPAARRATSRRTSCTISSAGKTRALAGPRSTERCSGWSPPESPTRSISAKAAPASSPRSAIPGTFISSATECHRSSEFLSSDIEAILEEVAAARSFEPVETVIQVFGVCEECRTGAKASTLDGAATELVFARDALRIAVATERSGLEFYTRAAALASDPRGREVFQRLAEDEKHHLGTLEKRYAELIAHRSDARSAADVPVLQGCGPGHLRGRRREAARRRRRSAGAAHRHPLRARLAQVLQEVRRSLRRLRGQADLSRIRRGRTRRIATCSSRSIAHCRTRLGVRRARQAFESRRRPPIDRSSYPLDGFRREVLAGRTGCACRARPA